MVTALNVCNNILKRSFDSHNYITPMKLQKLLYLTYKKYYKDTNGHMLFSEPFEVWKYGPVVRSVYEAFKDYKANQIKDYYLESDGGYILIAEDKAKDFKKTLDYIWKKYGDYSGVILSNMTHKEGTAWWIAYQSDARTLSDKDIEEEGELEP